MVSIVCGCTAPGGRRFWSRLPRASYRPMVSRFWNERQWYWTVALAFLINYTLLIALYTPVLTTSRPLLVSLLSRLCNLLFVADTLSVSCLAPSSSSLQPFRLTNAPEGRDSRGIGRHTSTFRQTCLGDGLLRPQQPRQPRQPPPRHPAFLADGSRPLLTCMFTHHLGQPRYGQPLPLPLPLARWQSDRCPSCICCRHRLPSRPASSPYPSNPPGDPWEPHTPYAKQVINFQRQAPWLISTQIKRRLQYPHQQGRRYRPRCRTRRCFRTRSKRRDVQLPFEHIGLYNQLRCLLNKGIAALS